MSLCRAEERRAGPARISVYVKLVEALCAECQINLIKIDGKKLGEWVGLCKTDRGKPHNVVSCGCVVIKGNSRGCP